MKIAIFGASGFLGTHLIRHMLDSTDWSARAVARNPDKLSEAQGDMSGRVEVCKGDVTDYDSLLPLMHGIDAAYYFVHMMGHKGVDFYQAELEAADTFARAATAANLPRIVFMGGLGDDAAKLSKHLASRHRSGKILQTSSSRVIELRASMIIGKGSVAFDIIRNIVEKLPVMVLPKAADTLTQPIALEDALSYLTGAASLQTSDNVVIEIGGPEQLSYADIYRRYSEYAHTKHLLLRVPFIPLWASSWFLDLLTPKVHARIGQAMVESLPNEMIVHGNSAKEHFPDIVPKSIESAFGDAKQQPSSDSAV